MKTLMSELASMGSSKYGSAVGDPKYIGAALSLAAGGRADTKLPVDCFSKGRTIAQPALLKEVEEEDAPLFKPSTTSSKTTMSEASSMSVRKLTV